MTRRAALEEKARRLHTKRAILDDCSDWQREVIVHPSKYKSVLAGRRSGKTSMDALYLATELEACGPLDWCFHSAVTRQVAKDHMWERLSGINEKHNLGWNMKEHEGLIVSRRGGHLRLLGFDKMPEVEKACGYRIKIFSVDEPHSYAQRLEYLIDQKLGPALLDLDGTLLVNGTPGVARFGYWFQVSTGQKPEYACWHRTIRDNTKFPRDVEAALAKVLKDKGWTVETPAFRREYLAEWVNEEDVLVYRYVPQRNERALPELDPAGLYTLGVDFGMDNATAWTVWYSPPHSKEAYCIRSFKQSQLIPDQACEVTRELVEKYRPSTIVGDAGGLGKPYVETWNRRYGNQAGMYMKPADKLGKLANVETLNGELRTPRAFIVTTECAQLVDEYSTLIWADERRDKEDPQCQNDCADSALYAFNAHYAYLQQAAPDPVSAEERARLERFAKAAERRKAEETLWDY